MRVFSRLLPSEVGLTGPFSRKDFWTFRKKFSGPKVAKQILSEARAANEASELRCQRAVLRAERTSSRTITDPTAEAGNYSWPPRCRRRCRPCFGWVSFALVGMRAVIPFPRTPLCHPEALSFLSAVIPKHWHSETLSFRSAVIPRYSEESSRPHRVPQSGLANGVATE
jgi:hypothetical protein